MNRKTLKLTKKRQQAIARSKEFYDLRLNRYKFKEIGAMKGVTPARAQQIVAWYEEMTSK